MPAGGNRLIAAVRRLAPPADGSDADLLGRFVAVRDEAAFEALVRRHGPMVHAACRRELGPGPDADDAYQVAFLVLARDARRISVPAALPGWLHRVARLSARKLRGRRRLTVEVRPDDAADPADPVRAAVGRELWAALDRELDSLSDKLRAVFVLCCLEDRSSGEAARVLGCPVGTVESRLAAAREKLRGRLARRGFGLPAAGLAATTADGAATRLAPAVVAAAVSDTALTHPLTSIADGVTPMLGTKLKLLVAAGMTAAVFGTAGLGLVRVSADPPKADAPPVVEAKPAPPKPDDPPAPDKPAETPGPPVLRTEVEVRAALSRPVTDLPPSLPLRDLFDDLHARYGILARLDVAEFKRLGNGVYGGMAAAPRGRDEGLAFVAAAVPEDEQVNAVMDLYDARIRFPVTRGLTVGDVLAEAVAQLPGKCRYRVRGNQVLVGPAFIPPFVPGQNAEGGDGPAIPRDRMIEQIVGEPVSVALDNVSLVDAIKELRRLTGANIVLDSRCKDDAKGTITGTFDDTRLLTVLTVLADQCGLKPVAMNNVYYVTSEANADRLQKGINRELFGEPDPPPASSGLGGGVGTPPAAGMGGGKK